jgi:hypothetical protein
VRGASRDDVKVCAQLIAFSHDAGRQVQLRRVERDEGHQVGVKVGHSLHKVLEQLLQQDFAVPSFRSAHQQHSGWQMLAHPVEAIEWHQVSADDDHLGQDRLQCW